MNKVKSLLKSALLLRLFHTGYTLPPFFEQTHVIVQILFEKSENKIGICGRETAGSESFFIGVKLQFWPRNMPKRLNSRKAPVMKDGHEVQKVPKLLNHSTQRGTLIVSYQMCPFFPLTCCS